MGQLTPFAGLWELNAGDSLAENGYQFFENEAITDAYINAFVTHRHDGHAAVQPFSGSAALTAHSSGGTLKGNDTWYVGVTALDVYGGETNSPTPSAITLPAQTADPSVAPTLTASGTGGALTAGTYRYVYTLLSGGGETMPSPVANVTVDAQGKVLIGVPNGGADWRLYRSFGYSPMSRVGSGAILGVNATFLDDGSLPTYQGSPPPDINTTLATCSFDVARPTMPTGAAKWRVYVNRDSSLPSPSLWASGGTVTDLASAVTSITVQNEGQIVLGSPPERSRTIAGNSPILATDVTYSGHLSLASGSVENALNWLAASAASAAAGVFVHLTGDNMSGPLYINHGSAGLVIVSSGATHAVELFKASGDTAPRVRIDHDGTLGRIYLSNGSTGILNEATISVDAGSTGAVSFGLTGITSQGGVTVTGGNSNLSLTGGNSKIDIGNNNGNQVILRTKNSTANAQYRFGITSSGTIIFGDGASYNIENGNQQPVQMSVFNMGKDTIIVDSTVVGSGGKLIHGLHSQTVTASAGTTIASGDIVYVDNSASAISFNFPATPKPGLTLGVKAMSATTNNVTIGRNGNNIEGAAGDYLMNAGTKEFARFHFPGNGTGWWKLG